MRITAALVLALATQAHAQTVTQIETSTTSDDILVSFDRPTCPGGGPAAIRESDKKLQDDHRPADVRPHDGVTAHRHHRQRRRGVQDRQRQDRRGQAVAIARRRAGARARAC